MQQPPDVDRLTDAALTASRALVAIAARSVASVADDVTLPQFRALVVLASRGPQPPHALADELGVVPSTVTRMCDRLERKGLVARSSHPTNRRELSVALTEAGRSVVDEVTRSRRLELRRVLSRLPAAERGAVVDAFEAFARAAGEVPEQGWYLGWV